MACLQSAAGDTLTAMSPKVRRLLKALPRGDALDERSWQMRHRVLLVVLAGHLPMLLVVGMLARWGFGHSLAELVPAGLALLLGLLARTRATRALAVTFGLVFCSAVLVHLTGGLIEAHFHYFVVLGLILLYEDWRPYAFAFAFVVVGHGSIGALTPEAMYNHPAAVARPWLWALIHGGYVLALAAGQIVFWNVMEREHERARRYYRQLYEGEHALAARQRQAEELKKELIGIVSHEFRTPLTSIMGFSQTLTARLDYLDHETALTCARNIERQSRRLCRLVHNLLLAGEEIDSRPAEVVDLGTLAAKVVEEVAEFTPASTRVVHLRIAPELGVGMSAENARQVLEDLLDNALKFAEPQTVVRVDGHRRDDEVIIEVANVGGPIAPEDAERIFEPFVQADSSDSRRHGGIGLGLHVVRKIVEAHGGRVEVHQDGPNVVFTVYLRGAGCAADGPPASARGRQVIRLPVEQPAIG